MPGTLHPHSSFHFLLKSLASCSKSSVQKLKEFPQSGWGIFYLRLVQPPYKSSLFNDKHEGSGIFISGKFIFATSFLLFLFSLSKRNGRYSNSEDPGQQGHMCSSIRQQPSTPLLPGPEISCPEQALSCQSSRKAFGIILHASFSSSSESFLSSSVSLPIDRATVGRMSSLYTSCQLLIRSKSATVSQYGRKARLCFHPN